MLVVGVVERDRCRRARLSDVTLEGEPRARVDAFDEGRFVVDGHDDGAIGADDAVMAAGGGKSAVTTRPGAGAQALRCCGHEAEGGSSASGERERREEGDVSLHWLRAPLVEVRGPYRPTRR